MSVKKIKNEKIGAALVIGGGIAGVQASLDLAALGQKVYLLESSPAIGGHMAQLDKTFPTNDCSMCILSPKIVECGRHLNIEIISLGELRDLTGAAGNFRATIVRKARYVDLEKCTGCGDCLKVCPVRRLRSEFDVGLRARGAIDRPFPQALPNAPAIDPRHCIRLKTGKCGLCAKACKAEAINFNDEDRESTIKVGAVIVTPGFYEFVARGEYDLGWSRFPDVVTSMEFERMLSASGPFSGHVKRISDGGSPAKIAFLQCVGSRDVSCRNRYCSSVCCMYAIKQAVIAREHIKGLEATVFFMDMRAFGKDFDKYYERAKSEHGVKFIRARASDVSAVKDSGELMVKYASESGTVEEQKFDMIVLSVGLEPSVKLRELALKLGIKLEPNGFLKTNPMDPLQTSRSGVFVGGVASGPKDIPETVVQASAAAGRAGQLLANARNTLTEEKQFPAEQDVLKEAPRIGVFVCHCGINIGGVVNVPSVAEFALTLPDVVHSEDNLYACSQDVQDHIKEIIQKHKLNRVVVASCSPRTHEQLFQETLRESGLNPHLFEMANIRDQCSWIHANEPEEATEKAKCLLRMAVAKVALVEPLAVAKLDVNQSALIIGGGAAGMTAALAVAEQGFKVELVERETRLGGNLLRLKYTLEEPDLLSYAQSLEKRVRGHANIKVRTGALLSGVDGFVGNFESTVTVGKKNIKIKHGVFVLATGGQESKPQEYLYGKRKDVITQLELEQRLSSPDALKRKHKTIVMIQCVGSREQGHMYCSRVCCGQAVKNALKIKKLDPDASIYILYRDMRTYGFAEERFAEARDKGVVFIRYELDSRPVVESAEGRLNVSALDPVLDRDILLHPDLLVLSSRIDTQPESDELSKILKVPMNEDRFFLEAHVKLRPVEFATEGVFVAGLAHSPKSLSETIAQAEAAASKACAIISKDKYEAEPTIAALNDDLCDGCGICVPVCEYNAIEVIRRPGGKEEEKTVKINEAMCKGCGGCVAACPSGAMEQKGFKNDQILAMIKAALEK